MIDENVIHVRFGPGGGRRVDPASAPASVSPSGGPPSESLDEARREDSAEPRLAGRKGAEPYGDLFGRREVAHLFEIPEGRLLYWARSGFLAPSGKVGRRRFYTFQDLIGIRAAKELLERGAPLPAVRRSLETLKNTLPHVTRPLNELRVVVEGQTVVVRGQDAAFVAETGQLQMDFEVSDIRDDVVRVLRPGHVDPERRRRAYDAYLEGCRLDEDEGTFERAEACYREAILLDPGLANALTNWGNLRFRYGDVEEAERLYHRALAIDDEQPEALYNLGFLAYERGQMSTAAELFARAADYDPGFADARFNLAMALEELGRSAEARAHWLAYLELDPNGSWAEIAKKHLKVR